MVAQRLPPALPQLPDPSSIDAAKPEEIVSFLSSLTATLSRHLQQRPTPYQIQDQVLLNGADGLSYRVRVDGTGALVAEPLGSVNDAPVPP